MSHHPSPFDAIRRMDENGNEYWSVRELAKVLGYDRWENFRRYVIPRTQKAFEKSEHAVSDHIRGTTKMIKTVALEQMKRRHAFVVTRDELRNYLRPLRTMGEVVSPLKQRQAFLQRLAALQILIQASS